MSTGQRLLTDDPAGILRAERLKNRIREINAEIRGFNDQISYYQIGEGTAGEIQDVVGRMKELAVQSANGSTSDRDRDTLQEEFVMLRDEIDRMVNSANFADGIEELTAADLGVDALDIDSSGDVDTALDALDTAFDTVSSVRALIGASINVLDHRIRTMRVEADNLEAARSRAVDVDLAEETAHLVRQQILQQAAIGVLAQANAQPQNLLRLLSALP